MSIAEKDGDKLAVIYAHFNYYTISFFALSAEQKTEVMSKMQAGLKLAQDGNFKNEETLILSRIAHKYAFYDLNFEKAISYFNMADLNNEKVSDSARSDFYYYKSAYYSVKKENLEMFRCNLNALKYAEKCRSVYYLTRAYRTLGVFYKEINNFEKAMYWHQKEYDLHTANKDKRGINNTNFIIARGYRDWGKNNEAIERYSTVITESIRINDRFNKDLATGELFNLYLRLGEIRQADSLNEKYQLIERNLTNKDFFSYNWIKGQYFSFFNADSAKHYYNNAVSFIDSSTSLRIKISFYKDIASVQRKTGEAQNAVSFLQKALAMNNELKLLSYYPDILGNGFCLPATG
jgi:tetratricopeptide (TPR) repeat protein